MSTTRSLHPDRDLQRLILAGLDAAGSGRARTVHLGFSIRTAAGKLETIAASSHVPVLVDQAQAVSGQGPSIDLGTPGHAVELSAVDAAHIWPDLPLTQLGITALLLLEVPLSGRSRAVLTLYYEQSASSTADDRTLLMALGRHVANRARTLLQEPALQPGRSAGAPPVIAALLRRTGSRHHLCDADAFRYLLDSSERAGMSLFGYANSFAANIPPG